MKILIQTWEKIIAIVNDGKFAWLGNMCYCTEYSYEEGEKKNIYKYIHVCIYNHRSLNIQHRFPYRPHCTKT